MLACCYNGILQLENLGLDAGHICLVILNETEGILFGGLRTQAAPAARDIR